MTERHPRGLRRSGDIPRDGHRDAVRQARRDAVRQASRDALRHLSQDEPFCQVWKASLQR